MKKALTLPLAALLLLAALAGCSSASPSPSAPAEKTPEELSQLYADAITANGGEMVEYNPVLSAVSEEDDSAFVLEMMGLAQEDMTAFGLSVSMMNVKAYGIAAIRPAEGKQETIVSALQAYVEQQQRSFEHYLEDQYEIAKAARLETLEDGTVLMVITENADTVFEAIKTAILAQ